MSPEEYAQYITAVADLSTMHPRLTGSRAIIGSGEDIDILLLCTRDSCAVVESMGYVLGGQPEYAEESARATARRGGINLIMAFSNLEYCSWWYATEVCSSMHKLGYSLADKAKRVAAFKLLRTAVRIGFGDTSDAA